MPEAFPRSGEGGCAQSKQTDEGAGKQHFTLTPLISVPGGFSFSFHEFYGILKLNYVMYFKEMEESI